MIFITKYFTEQITKYITPVLITAKAASHCQEDDQSLTWEGGFSFRDAGSSALQLRLSGCRPSRRKREQGSGKALLGTAFCNQHILGLDQERHESICCKEQFIF